MTDVQWPVCSRRSILKASGLALLPLAIPSMSHLTRTERFLLKAEENQAPMTATGGTDPYPIPWPHENGSH